MRSLFAATSLALATSVSAETQYWCPPGTRIVLVSGGDYQCHSYKDSNGNYDIRRQSPPIKIEGAESNSSYDKEKREAVLMGYQKSGYYDSNSGKVKLVKNTKESGMFCCGAFHPDQWQNEEDAGKDGVEDYTDANTNKPMTNPFNSRDTACAIIVLIVLFAALVGFAIWWKYTNRKLHFSADYMDVMPQGEDAVKADKDVAAETVDAAMGNAPATSFGGKANDNGEKRGQKTIYEAMYNEETKAQEAAGGM